MFQLELYLYLYLKNEEDREGCRKAKTADHILLSISSIEKPDDFFLPEHQAAIVITDDAKFACGLAAPHEPALQVVFIGENEEVQSLFGLGVLDIWPIQESKELRAARCSALIRRTRDQAGYGVYQDLLTATIETSPDLIWYKRKDGVHALVNDMFANAVGKNKEEIIGKKNTAIWETLDEKSAKIYSSTERATMESGRTLSFDEPIMSCGKMKQFTTYKTPIYDWFGKLWGTVGFGHDVTDFSNMGHALTILVDSLPFPVLLMDPDWGVVKMNEEFRGILEANGDDWENFDYRKWKGERFHPVREKKVDEEHHSAVEEVEIKLLGSPWIYIVTEREIRDSFDHLTGYICLFNDVTFQRTYEQRILTAANTDAMTGLYNRRYFYEYMKNNVNGPQTLLYMDLDHFKEVNDTQGHAMGDHVIIRTAELIKELFPDGVGARLGGDEYAVLLPGKKTQEELAERCREMEIAVRNIDCGGDVFVTVSIGVARTSGKGYLSADELIRIADRQMYDVKAEHHKNGDEINASSD